MKTIPTRNKKEWKELVTGQLNVPLKNFFFQMKLTQTKNLLLNKKISIEKAVEDIHSLCVKFSKAKNMDKDIEAIFGVHEIVEGTEAVQLSKTAVNDNGELVTQNILDVSSEESNKISFVKDELENRSEELNRISFVKDELEKIKREAAKKEAEFKRKSVEFQEKIAIETKAREEAVRIAETERKNRILQEERNNKEQKNKQNRLDREKIERESLRQASIKRREIEQQKQSTKKRTFFQKLFNLD